LYEVLGASYGVLGHESLAPARKRSVAKNAGSGGCPLRPTELGEDSWRTDNASATRAIARVAPLQDPPLAVGTLMLV